MFNARGFLRRLRHTRLDTPDIKLAYRHFGSDYGGWPVIVTMIRPDSIVYAVGVGTDATFDLALIDATGCTVHAFDPTPRSLAWVKSREWPKNWHFHALGVANRDEIRPFFEPLNPDHVSFSARPTASTSAATALPVRRLATIMSDLGHSEIDLLKMDIEGFEYDVIDDLVDSGVRPTQLLVEFHHGMYGIEAECTLAATSRLRAAGYRLFSVSDNGREYGFLDHRYAEGVK